MGFLKLQLSFWLKKKLAEREIEPGLLACETLILTTRPPSPSLKMSCTQVCYNFDVIHKMATLFVGKKNVAATKTEPGLLACVTSL